MSDRSHSVPHSAKGYPGIHNDPAGVMSDTAKIIRDAWVFGLLPEGDTCEGWLAPGIENLWHKVDAEWEKYGFRVNNLPEELRERFMRLHGEALEQAKSAGWDGDNELGED